jgi:hypothetical protein
VLLKSIQRNYYQPCLSVSSTIAVLLQAATIGVASLLVAGTQNWFMPEPFFTSPA